MSARRLGVLLVAVALAALVPACARQPRGAAGLDATDGGVPIDASVMAYLSLARALHHEASLKEEGDVPGAIAALEHLTAAPRPHPSQRVPEVEEVLADTYARIAELQVRQEDLTRASASVKEGLAHAPEPSYFRGHLLEVGGIAEEARARVLRDAGRAGEAESAKTRALELLHEAVVVQERVVRETLAEDAGPGKGSGR